jgi:CHAD domain-containing protein
VLQPDLPAAVAVARVLLSFLGEMEAGLDGTVADVDVEFPHDFRVAVRRSRSTVKLLGDVLPPALVAWVTPQLAWLGELTSPSRDLDVQLQELPALSARLTAARPEDLEPLALHLTGLRTDERRVLVRGLRSARFERWRTRWRSALEELATVDDRPCAGPTAAELGVRRLAGVDRRVLRRGSRITAASPAEDLHNLRKRCKELRYLLEICTPLLAPGAARGAVAELKTLQDVLGTFQDSEAHREAIYAVAADMMTRGAASSRTILAMGELAGRLQEDQDSARAQYADRFQRFARRSVQRRIARLRQPAAAAAAGSSGGSR